MGVSRCVRADLVLKEQHNVPRSRVENRLQVGGQLLLLHDVTRCGRGLSREGDPDGTRR